MRTARSSNSTTRRQPRSAHRDAEFAGAENENALGRCGRHQRPERPARRGSQSFPATKTAHEFQLHPTALGIQAPTPDTFQLRDMNLRQIPDDIT